MLLKWTISWRWLNARDLTVSSAVMFSRICRISAAHFEIQVVGGGGGGGGGVGGGDDVSSVRILVILCYYLIIMKIFYIGWCVILVTPSYNTIFAMFATIWIAACV